jgi:glycosyltransferase involved in cell wall biosynthesis
MEKKGITVIIPTFNCKNLLLMTIESLCKQVFDRSLFEVIVVDDGSSDGTQEAVEAYPGPLRLSYYFQEDLGFRVAGARNIGIRYAMFPIILFLDAGILVSSRLLDLHYSKHLEAPDQSVIGLSYGVTEHHTSHAELISKLTSDNIDDSLSKMNAMDVLYDCRHSFFKSISYDLTNMAHPWLVFWGGHVSVPTSLLKAVGGFDEWFNRWGGEDVELGLRLQLTGVKFVALRTIESIHYPHHRDADQKKKESQINVRYIHQKHKLSVTEMLTRLNWEQIVVATQE